MAQIDGLGSATALKSSDLFMVNQNTSTEGPEVRLENRLALSDLMTYINTNFDPTSNINSSSFYKKETITGTCTTSVGQYGFTYSGNRYVGVSGIKEPVFVRVYLNNTSNPEGTYHSSGILVRGGYSYNTNVDASTFIFLGNGGLRIGVYTTDSSSTVSVPVLDMASLVSSPGTTSYTVEVCHLKSASTSLTLYDASIVPDSWLPKNPVFSDQKTTIKYPSTLPQTPDDNVVYML